MKTIHEIIPSGAHTYSKTDNQFSSNAPKFVIKARDSYFWGIDKKKYLDYGMGLFSVSLGHSFKEVNDFIIKGLRLGNNFSRPSILERQLAEKIIDLIPCAEMVKFSKNGSDVNSAAVRLARHFTGKDLVVRCNGQPFYSFNDWFIGSTNRHGGIPQNIKNQTLRFNYNDIDSLEKLFEENKNSIACIMMEPSTFFEPLPNFLKSVKEVCHKNGALLIFDEMITGFRWDLKGAQNVYKVVPDMATFGKGIANGFPLSVLTGRKEILNSGKMDGEVFLLSCTYGGESIGINAALKTIECLEKYNVINHFYEYGRSLKLVICEAINNYKLENCIQIIGADCRPEIQFITTPNETNLELKTLFIQEMVKQNILMERICISYSHGKKELEKTKIAINKTFKIIKNSILSNSVRKKIIGDIIKPIFTY